MNITRKGTQCVKTLMFPTGHLLPWGGGTRPLGMLSGAHDSDGYCQRLWKESWLAEERGALEIDSFVSLAFVSF